MTTRGKLIAALVVIEIAIIGEAWTALFGSPGSRWSAPRFDAQSTTDSRLVEGGPHKHFVTGHHPALTIDIGYADLTILPSNGSQIEVGVAPSTTTGMFFANAPLVAQKVGSIVRVTTSGSWGIGDDRMVTARIPADTDVTVINAGNIHATGLRASASFNSIGGDGTVAVDDFAGPTLHVTLQNGRIALHQIVAGRLDAIIRHGHVEGTALQVRNGSVESNGRVMLGFAAGADTLVTAETNNGAVNVSGFLAPSSAGISNLGNNNDDSSSQTVRVGAGDGHFDVHSSEGNITLAQEG